MKCLIIYTPHSMKGKFEKKLPFISQELSKKFDVSALKTQYEKHACKIAEEACGVYDLILAAGGDGLVNEVINGISNQGNPPAIAVLPCGTVNDFSKSLKMPKKLDKALNVILFVEPQFVDVMKTNSSYACYIVCAGTHTEATYLTRQKNKKIWGWLAYFFTAIKTIFKPLKHNFDCYVDGKKLNSSFDFVMIMNSISIAGFKLNKGAVLNDGNFDVLMLKSNKVWFRKFKKYLNLLSLFLFGVKSLKNRKQAIVIKTDNLKIVNKLNSAFNVDGEKFEAGNELNVTVLKNKIKMINNTK